ncbi:ATP12 family chaperone protein [Erythrobacter sp. AP23]|uniref:ATP12 family chaperone protein n=1 Tax=Erythrobacter sp. AP23 TaxID=499656 RepID=UPI00076CACBA|nr:ATP12 family protein [Erythrobacter sp. AP23]KWV92586.1 molecular chaperone [Erythrobacter sp. AP23]
MKRFYKDVTIEKTELGYHVALDGRPLKTQGGKPQVVESQNLAEALAAEWAEQGETLDAARFALRDMADYALDVVPATRAEIVAKMLRYVETDTLCYRAGPDEPFWHRQRDVWDPLVEAMETREGIKLERVSGIVARPHSPKIMKRLRARLEDLDDFALAALEQLASLAASLCVGLAALEDDADGEALWAAANLEEDWQVEQWGQDEEANARRARRLGEFLKAMEFARLARG